MTSISTTHMCFSMTPVKSVVTTEKFTCMCPLHLLPSDLMEFSANNGPTFRVAKKSALISRNYKAVANKGHSWQRFTSCAERLVVLLYYIFKVGIICFSTLLHSLLPISSAHVLCTSGCSLF